ncbi:MAG: PocR ligand-binding domain-containing protein [Clostridiales bacterium]|jgi:hypothetical protein|nr:PocR ligand-binding domain-containing protein [Clostridiales bacterium]
MLNFYVDKHTPVCGILGEIVIANSTGQSVLWREACCNECDKAVARSIYKHHQSKKKLPIWLKQESYKSTEIINYYSYKCQYTTFTEWAVPLYVQGTIYGLIITGQFQGKGYNPETAKEALSEHMKCENISDTDIRKTLAELKEYEKTSPFPDSNQQEEFFSDLQELQQTLEKEYEEYKKNWIARSIAEIENKMMSYVLDTNERYSSTYINFKDFDTDFTARFRAARTNLFEGLFFVKCEFDLMNITVFKPRSDIGNFDSTNQIDGANLLKEDMPKDLLNDAKQNTAGSSDSLPFDRIFSESKSYLSYNSTAWKKQFHTERSNVPLLSIQKVSGVACMYWITNDPHEKKKYQLCNLYVFNSHTNMQFAIAYLLEFKNSASQKASSDWAERILRSASTAFMMQWKAVDADAQSYQSEVVAKHITHELGSIATGMDGITAKMDSYNQKANIEKWRNSKKFEDEYPDTNNLLNRIVDYQDGMQIYAELITVNSRSSVLADVSSELNKRPFFPYQEFLFRLFQIFDMLLESEHKKLSFPKGIDRSDSTRPKMFADPLRMEQVTYNLLNNARKYSHPGTQIYVDCRLSEDGANYILSVTNYGEPFDEDWKDLLSLGKRGSNVEECSGTGYGLYLSDKYIRMHGGTLTMECKPISPYCVPVLSVYNRNFLGDPAKKNEYEEEIYRLKADETYYSVVGPPISIKEHSLLYFERLVEIPTAEITVTCILPYKQGD